VIDIAVTASQQFGMMILSVVSVWHPMGSCHGPVQSLFVRRQPMMSSRTPAEERGHTQVYEYGGRCCNKYWQYTRNSVMGGWSGRRTGLAD
jgi:hypothetical protein